MFIIFHAICFLCATAWAAPSNEINPHIVGGTPAPEGSYPFVVSLRYPSIPKTFFCGGGLISKKHVLTAAHCVAKKKEVKIGFGSVRLDNQKIIDSESIKVHPQYNSTTSYNDIAIIKLKESVPLREDQLVKFNCNESLDGKSVTALGWGQIKEVGPVSNTLLYLKKPITPNKDCSKNLDSPIHNGQICLGSTKNYGMCFGDSGSPLLYQGVDKKNYTVGIVSWGIPCAKGYPDVFTRVSYYKDFIEKNLK